MCWRWKGCRRRVETTDDVMLLGRQRQEHVTTQIDDHKPATATACCVIGRWYTSIGVLFHSYNARRRTAQARHDSLPVLVGSLTRRMITPNSFFVWSLYWGSKREQQTHYERAGESSTKNRREDVVAGRGQHGQWGNTNKKRSSFEVDARRRKNILHVW